MANKKIIRVFPIKTSYTPTDEYAFIGMPPMSYFIPEHDEVHISCTFTWDKPACEELAYQWEAATNKPVKFGGVAYGSPTEETHLSLSTVRKAISGKYHVRPKTAGCIAHALNENIENLLER